MRRCLSILLVFLVSWQLLFKGSIFLWFGINQAYIAKNWCINRDKPELQCNGKCVLMQRLKAVEEERREAQERPLRLVEKLELSHFLVEALPILDFLVFYIHPETTVPSESVTSSVYFLRLLKPPEVPFFS